MYYRIPNSFFIDVKRCDDLDLPSSDYRCSCEEKIEEDPFKEADEEYVNESIKE